MRSVSIYLGGVFLFLLLPLASHAASLYIDPASSSIARGDAIKLSVRLDTDEAAGECVNAVDGVIHYSENIAPVDISIGDSILSMWVEQPIINSIDRTITFAGGIPNGYCGRIAGDPRLTNTLVELIFRSPGFSIGSSDDGPNVATVGFAPESAAYLNDGFGTKAELTSYGATIELLDVPGTSLSDTWREELLDDEIAPEEFSISLQKDTSAFGGKYFIEFNTSDKQTGIDQYQVIEEPLSQIDMFAWGRADAPWEVTRSPYVLNDQSLNSVIRVKALDKAGNEYVATLIPDDTLKSISLSQYIVYGFGALITLLLLSISLVGFRSLRRRRANKLLQSEVANQNNSEHDND